ncbi:MAG: hypothetical protein FWF82_04435, partial [Oscillospiraceae bacterium]|nr:hypothetical protein [Oscillospiraceae bacterium]
DLSVTQILNESSGRSHSDLSVTQILNESFTDSAKPTSQKESDNPTMSDEHEINIVKPVQLKRFTPHDKSAAKKSDAPNESPETPKTSQTPQTPKSGEVQNEKKFEEITADIVNLSKPAKPSYKVPETPKKQESEQEAKREKQESEQEKKELQKLREEELLEKELAIENPDELIDGINPYDVQNIDTVQKAKEQEEAAILKSPTLETLHAKPTKPPKPILEIIPEGTDTDLDKVKEYKGDKSAKKPQLFNKSDNAGGAGKKKGKPKSKAEFKEELDFTPLLENLNKSFAQKRREDIGVRRTLNVDTLGDSLGDTRVGKGKTLPAKLNIDYKKQIIQDSAVLPHTGDIHAKQIEERELGKKKKRKIRDFILEDIDDDDDEEFFYEEEADYDGYDSSAQVWNDLNESHKGLKWRFSLLLVVTVMLTFFTFVHDTGGGNTGLRQSITTQFFGADNSSGYAAAYVYASLIAGMAGIVLCSGVVLRGMKNLFLGKADCDSACALPIVGVTLLALVQVVTGSGTTLVEQNRAHVYVCAALTGLLFNTFGKIIMIVRTKKNFGFISGDSVKYSAFMPAPDENGEVRAITKGIVDVEPVPVFLQRTEFLTDYLKNSYCIDWADLICRKLVPASAIAAVVMGLAGYFLPFGNAQLVGDIRWAATAAGAFLVVLSPFSIMFLVNNPLLKAANSLAQSDCVVMGYTAAHKYSRTNAAVVDAEMLFPPGSLKFLNVKRCQKPNAINSVSIDESIIIAASLAIKGKSVMSSMFNDMIANNTDLLYKIENCIYEVNMGINGWMGAKRVMLGNREQMQHHGIDVPAKAKEQKHCPENGEVVYLAVGSETVAMFFIEVIPNTAVRHGLWELEANGVSLAVKSKDSIVTVAKLADIYELNPEKVRILPYDQHTTFDDFSRYTSRGNSEIACNGTFTSFVRALVTAKALIRDMMVTSASMFVSVFLAGLLGLMFVLFSATSVLSATAVMLYNLFWLAVMLVLQALRKY